jgi:hypothetical protein
MHAKNNLIYLTHLFIYFCVAKIKPRAFHMLGKCSTTELHPRPNLYFRRDRARSGWYGRRPKLVFQLKEREREREREMKLPTHTQTVDLWQAIFFVMIFIFLFSCLPL